VETLTILYVISLKIKGGTVMEKTQYIVLNNSKHTLPVDFGHSGKHIWSNPETRKHFNTLDSSKLD